MREPARIRPYWPGDAALLAPQARQREEASGEFVRALAAGGAPEGAAWTLTRAGRPIACAGLATVMEGRRYYAWLLAGDLYLGEWGRIARAMRATLEESAAPRIEATSQCGFEGADSLLQTLGFQPEAVLHLFDGARDHRLWWRSGGAYSGRAAA